MSSAELSEWMAYEQISGPLGSARGDYHAAVISATIANGIRALGGKKGNRHKVGDFLIEWDRGRSRQLSPHEMLQEIKSINKALGGTEK